MPSPLAIIDFEASALAKDADVVEVGVAVFDLGTIRTWSSLVRSRSNGRWSAKAAAVHQISRVALE